MGDVDLDPVRDIRIRLRGEDDSASIASAIGRSIVILVTFGLAALAGAWIVANLTGPALARLLG